MPKAELLPLPAVPLTEGTGELEEELEDLEEEELEEELEELKELEEEGVN